MHEDEARARTSGDFGERRIISQARGQPLAPLRPVTSLMIEAPSPTATSATSGFDVSIEIGMVSDRDSRSSTGRIRAISSSALIGIRAGSCRLTADVDQVRTSRCHFNRGSLRRAWIEIQTAIGERIRRDVQDAHDEGTIPEMNVRLPGSWMVKVARGITVRGKG